MFPFSDQRLNDIYLSGMCEGIPHEVSQRVYLLLHVMVHTRQFSAVGAFGHVTKLAQNRFAIYIDRWRLTFSWDWDQHYVLEPALENI